MKKLLQRYQGLILFATVLVLALASLAGRPHQPSEVGFLPSPLPNQAATPLPSASAASTLNAASSLPLLGADIDSEARSIFFYNPAVGNFQSFDLKTNTTANVGKAPAGIRQIVWAPHHHSLVMVRNQPTDATHPFTQSKKVIEWYDLASGKQIALNDNIKALGFAGDMAIVYQYQEGRYNNLSLAKTDGSNWKNIKTLTAGTQIISTPTSALVKSIGETQVTRFDQDGKAVETYDVPSDFILNQSTWAVNGRNALYWVSNGKHLAVKRLKPEGSETVVETNDEEDDLTILWDNKTGTIYRAGLNGLMELGQSPL